MSAPCTLTVVLKAELMCQHCLERTECVDSDEFVQWFTDRHLPHLGPDEYILVIVPDCDEGTVERIIEPSAPN